MESSALYVRGSGSVAEISESGTQISRYHTHSPLFNYLFRLIAMLVSVTEQTVSVVASPV